MADVLTWIRWFHSRLAWRTVIAGIAYYVAPYAHLDPSHVLMVRDACMAVILGAVLVHEKVTPQSLFKIRRRPPCP
jgi:hypothetical protein